MLPESSMSILQPVSAQIFWMTLPPEPMTSRILSGLIVILIIFGAVLASSLRGSRDAGEHDLVEDLDAGLAGDLEALP